VGFGSRRCDRWAQFLLLLNAPINSLLTASRPFGGVSG
jgi:hypothetical protein